MNSHDLTTPLSNNERRRLDPEHQVAPTDQLVANILQTYGLDHVEWSEATNGIGHVVLRITDPNQQGYYLKFYNSLHSHDRVVREAAYTRHAHEQGVPVPVLYPAADGDIAQQITQPSGIHTYTLSSEIPGIHPAQYQQTHLQQLAVYHARLHNLPFHDAGTRLDIATNYHYYDIREDSNLAPLSHTVTNTVAPTIAQWTDLPSNLTHLDIARTNILVDGPHLTGIIDFEDLEQAPTAFCLAGTLWDIYESGDGDISGVEAYITNYEQHRPLQAVESANLKNLIILRGWIALHGSLMTKGENDQRAIAQQNLLWTLLEQS